MIYCPKCGTANRDGSRFCNECGQRLGAHTRVRCPQCGAFNSIKNVFCDDCGGRLLPAHGEAAASDAAVPIKGLSLPTKGPASSDFEDPAHDVPDEDEDVPGWLRELGSSWSSQGAAEQATGEGDEIPDWLKDLRESLPDEQEVGPGNSEEAEPPDWLTGMRAGAFEEPEEEETALAGGEVEGEPGYASGEPEYPSGEPEYPSDDLPDWLAELRGSAAGREPDRPVPVTPDAPDADVPDWLAGMRAGAIEEPEEEEPELSGSDEVDSTPDWLAELRGQAAGREPDRPAPVTPDVPGADVPDWLAGMRGGAVEEPEEEESALAGSDEADSTPDWLAELRGSAVGREPDRPAPVTPDLPAADMPDWLAEMRPGSVEEPEEKEPTTARGGEREPEYPSAELPDWLAELRGSKEQERSAPQEHRTPQERETPTEPPAPPAEKAEVPDWLASLRSGAEDEPPAPVPPRTSRSREEAGAGQMPDWLAALRPPGAEEPELDVSGTGGEPEYESGEPEYDSGEELDWLDDLRASRRETESEVEEGEIPDWLVASEGGFEEETLARAEIPEWLLALKPPALREEGEPEALGVVIGEPVEETGILAGLHGTLPVEMLIAQPRAATVPPTVHAPVADTPNARLFAEIVGRPIESAPKELAQPRRRLLSLLPRWLIYIALIGAVVLPLLAGEPLLPRDVQAGPPVLAMYEVVRELNEDSVVLVAFDYDPTSSGEMDVLAQALVGDIMDRGARVIVMSTLPAGPATAQMVLDDLAAERPLYGQYGERYANLGYVPGEAAGVRLLSRALPLALVRDFYANPLGDLEVLDDVVSATSFDLILELAATQETLRWWIEQAGAPYGIPLAAGTSGAVEPFARAYYQADPPQLVGLVAGVPGVVSYEVQSLGEPALDDRLAARLDSQLGGHLVFIVVLLVGGVVGLLRRDTGRED